MSEPLTPEERRSAMLAMQDAAESRSQTPARVVVTDDDLHSLIFRLERRGLTIAPIKDAARAAAPAVSVESVVAALDRANASLAARAAAPLDVERLRLAAKRSGWFCDDDEHRSAHHAGNDCYCEKVAEVLAARLSEDTRRG